MPISEDQAIDWVRRGARIRVTSGAVGCENVVMAEGKVISWCAAPSLTIEQADGTRTSWSADLPMVEVEWEKAEPYGIYSRWAKTGQTSKSVWTAIQEAYAAGQAATATRPYPARSAAASTDRVHLVHEGSVVTACCGKRLHVLPSGERWTARQELVNCAPQPAGVQFCNWCTEPTSPDPRAHPNGQPAHLSAAPEVPGE